MKCMKPKIPVANLTPGVYNESVTKTTEAGDGGPDHTGSSLDYNLLRQPRMAPTARDGEHYVQQADGIR
jgi:hypothetical protein